MSVKIKKGAGAKQESGESTSDTLFSEQHRLGKLRTKSEVKDYAWLLSSETAGDYSSFHLSNSSARQCFGRIYRSELPQEGRVGAGVK